LNDWGEVKAYEWIKSDVAPIDYDDVAAEEGGDTSIDESVRKSGTAKLTLYKNVDDLWEEIKAITQVFDVVIEGVYDVINDIYDFTTTAFELNDVVNVYVNGKIAIPDLELFSLVVSVEATVADRVTVIKPIPTDRNFIDGEVFAGNMLEAYQYVEIDKRDEFGNEVLEYFFWVENKSTKSMDKLRSDTLRGSVQTLETIPVPYMFFQELKPRSEAAVEGDKLLPEWNNIP